LSICIITFYKQPSLDYCMLRWPQ